ncbi:hypothetical protein OO013_19990 [Mangrovivirga sp. M17]|uniref:Nuclear transport factor 2 family protein n=1 Tax=Mangrovivirga halotolerans TaxID=2993936 RepID=A0ABT3RYG0_9BACT|nr:hypothetical protein [Mangrovivirga halotolerans]MCX2746170.1 hypothetical protein [Mangrovivirga halotolerans]
MKYFWIILLCVGCQLNDNKSNIEYMYSVYNRDQTIEDTISIYSDDLNIQMKTDTSNNEIRLIGHKEIISKFDTIIIYKYLFDNITANDEETLYFFNQRYGMIVIKSAWWGDYQKLISNGNKEDDETIKKLGDMIIFDKEFFKYK